MSKLQVKQLNEIEDISIINQQQVYGGGAGPHNGSSWTDPTPSAEELFSGYAEGTYDIEVSEYPLGASIYFVGTNYKYFPKSGKVRSIDDDD